MKREFSREWKSSKKRSKQRKYRHNAPLHIKQKFVHVHLSKELRKQFKKRALQLKKGDKVRVMRGSFKKHEAKVESINLKKSKVLIAGVEATKKDGNKRQLSVQPSNLMIIELNMDKNRQEITVRKK